MRTSWDVESSCACKDGGRLMTKIAMMNVNVAVDHHHHDHHDKTKSRHTRRS